MAERSSEGEGCWIEGWIGGCNVRAFDDATLSLGVHWFQQDSHFETTTIKMFESYEAWCGTIMGDGQKEKLTADLQRAVQSHRTYCKAYLPEGPLREAAIKTAKVMMLFWTSLVAYIEDKYTLLMAFKLLPKHVLLLLSNQVVS